MLARKSHASAVSLLFVFSAVISSSCYSASAILLSIFNYRVRVNSEEIDYVMMCVDANQDGKVDFNEFTDRFHSPAKDIGFNVAVLLTNLSEHIPNDNRLKLLITALKMCYFGLVKSIQNDNAEFSSKCIENFYLSIASKFDLFHWQPMRMNMNY